MGAGGLRGGEIVGQVEQRVDLPEQMAAGGPDALEIWQQVGVTAVPRPPRPQQLAVADDGVQGRAKPRLSETRVPGSEVWRRAASSDSLTSEAEAAPADRILPRSASSSG